MREGPLQCQSTTMKAVGKLNRVEELISEEQEHPRRENHFVRVEEEMTGVECLQTSLPDWF